MRTPGQLLIPLALILGSAVTAWGKDAFESQRRQLVQEAVIGNGVSDPRVIEAVQNTLRHEFVSLNQRDRAYIDMALPIGEDQTISSPFIVAYMTESLEPKPTDKVLEIGTGSGYQAAVLSPLVETVYSIEIMAPLGRRAERTLRRLGYRNVVTKIGDGYLGWEEHAPFDKIIVTCSPEKVPQPLIDQLREGGTMVVPVGERYQQTLYLYTKKNGKLEAQPLRPTLFVPMTGQAEKKREVLPDPLRPTIENGNFELPLGEHGEMQGWYYQRQVELVEDTQAPEGTKYVRFQNEDAGRPAMALQGFPIDGRRVTQLKISAMVKFDGARLGADRQSAPMILITYFDSQRRDIGRAAVGPFLGTQDWHRVEKVVRVPATAREAIFRIGLLDAMGSISFDDVKMIAGPGNPSP
ncbi:MAG: protein-L-isoaspartate(D-aspartate) O-methyltransferase [Pirellulaceae bacterium]